jgi:poly(ADP-ribose) glycohydrolase ARH3
MVREEQVGAIANARSQLRYTDDTHMTIGIAESLVECHGFDGAHMANCFIKNYRKEPWRGYGPGPPKVFRLIESGQPWDKAAGLVYPGGSFGNGSAMRVAPVGLLFWEEQVRLREVSSRSSLITHSHPLGIEGAVLQASAIALAVAASSEVPLDSRSFLSRLLAEATEEVYRDKLIKMESLLEHPENRSEVVYQLGNGIEAFNSVPTAIFAFLSHPQDFHSAIIYAISLGGDTDTIASMAGAISGAYLGIPAIPVNWLERLENRDCLSDLSDRLWRLVLESRDKPQPS